VEWYNIAVEAHRYMKREVLLQTYIETCGLCRQDNVKDIVVGPADVAYFVCQRTPCIVFRDVPGREADLAAAEVGADYLAHSSIRQLANGSAALCSLVVAHSRESHDLVATWNDKVAQRNQLDRPPEKEVYRSRVQVGIECVDMGDLKCEKDQSWETYNPVDGQCERELERLHNDSRGFVDRRKNAPARLKVGTDLDTEAVADVGQRGAGDAVQEKEVAAVGDVY
jgi:hypothetical protein